jgi:hypothetical protein
MFVFQRSTVVAVISMKRKRKRCDQVLVLRIAGEESRQKARKEETFQALNTASGFVKCLRTLLNEVFKCTKTLSQLLIVVLLMVEFCKEQQHLDVGDRLRPCTIEFRSGSTTDIAGIT